MNINPVQVFFMFSRDSVANRLGPSWIFNDKVSGSWTFIPFQLAHPWQLPARLRQYNCVLHQTGPEEDLLSGALRNHIFLSKDQLVTIQTEIGYRMTPKGSGHGKNGRLVKQDWAECLVNHFFNDTNSSRQARFLMVKALLGRGWKHTEATSKHYTHDIIQAFQCLEKEDEREYMEITQVAMDQEALFKAQESRGQNRESTHKGFHQHETPKTLQHLVPTNEQGVKCGAVYRHPVLKRYQGWYFAEPSPDETRGPERVIPMTHNNCRPRPHRQKYS